MLRADASRRVGIAAAAPSLPGSMPEGLVLRSWWCVRRVRASEAPRQAGRRASTGFPDAVARHRTTTARLLAASPRGAYGLVCTLSRGVRGGQPDFAGGVAGRGAPHPQPAPDGLPRQPDPGAHSQPSQIDSGADAVARARERLQRALAGRGHGLPSDGDAAMHHYVVGHVLALDGFSASHERASDAYEDQPKAHPAEALGWHVLVLPEKNEPP
mmetsp:Transcript_2688/g.8985  ORF Transcript_2688/g.8985 Transcript_2688/m.8985 type:complete len:214 (-) Transcript_2688:1788-2429(-)